MENKEELLQYLRTNFFQVGHPLYYAGINKIYYLFDGNLTVEDIEDFVQRHYPVTGDKISHINFS